MNISYIHVVYEHEHENILAFSHKLGVLIVYVVYVAPYYNYHRSLIITLIYHLCYNDCDIWSLFMAYSAIWMSSLLHGCFVTYINIILLLPRTNKNIASPFNTLRGCFHVRCLAPRLPSRIAGTKMRNGATEPKTHSLFSALSIDFSPFLHPSWIHELQTEYTVIWQRCYPANKSNNIIKYLYAMLYSFIR